MASLSAEHRREDQDGSFDDPDHAESPPQGVHHDEQTGGRRSPVSPIGISGRWASDPNSRVVESGTALESFLDEVDDSRRLRSSRPTSIATSSLREGRIRRHESTRDSRRRYPLHVERPTHAPISAMTIPPRLATAMAGLQVDEVLASGRANGGSGPARSTRRHHLGSGLRSQRSR